VNTEELPGLAQRLRINAIPLMAQSWARIG